MLTLSEKEISIFKSIIGSGISYCSSDELAVYPSHATSLASTLMLGFKNKTDHTRILFNANFFENRDGGTFYDYTIIVCENEPSKYDNAKLILGTSPIQKITVYGREIDWNNFDNVADLRSQYDSKKQTDDLFHFQCQNEQLLFVFHPFLPQAEFIYSLGEIRQFFDLYSNTYKLHYEFGNTTNVSK